MRLRPALRMAEISSSRSWGDMRSGGFQLGTGSFMRVETVLCVITPNDNHRKPSHNGSQSLIEEGRMTAN
jgi:hypothetical protein